VACPRREIGCGEQRLPKWRPVIHMWERTITVLGWGRGDMNGRFWNIVFQVAVCFL
jgi:hypothetical protein